MKTNRVDPINVKQLYPVIPNFVRLQKCLHAVLPFSKLNKTFFGYFDPENIFQIIKINIFWGELTDNSAKKEALLARCRSIPVMPWSTSRTGEVGERFCGTWLSLYQSKAMQPPSAIPRMSRWNFPRIVSFRKTASQA